MAKQQTFVDTNLFIRYLTDDDHEKADRVGSLLQKAARGEMVLVTAELVLAEVVWVLESAYGLGCADIAPLIRGILGTPGLRVVNGDLVARALDHYESLKVDFTDGYIAALMEAQGITEIFSFDQRHMKRFAGLARKEP